MTMGITCIKYAANFTAGHDTSMAASFGVILAQKSARYAGITLLKSDFLSVLADCVRCSRKPCALTIFTSLYKACHWLV